MKKYIYLVLLTAAALITSCNNSSSTTTNNSDTVHVQDSLPRHDTMDVSNPDAPSEPH